MTAPPIRLSVVLTHPVQYYAPWFRYIAQYCPEIALTVLYATEPTAQQQGVGFGTPFEWDVPLRGGYDSHVVRRASGAESLHSNAFFGLDVPEIVPAMLDPAPDVVLIPGWHSVTLVRALRACRRHGIPTLYRGDTNLQSRPGGWRRSIWAVKTRVLLGHYSAYLSVGVNARDYLAAFGVVPDRIFDAPHCVDNDFFERAGSPWRAHPARQKARCELGIAPESFVLLYVGKLEAAKRVEDPIEAVARCGSNVQLVIVGDGVERDRLQALARSRGTSVTWLGFLNQSELGRAYAIADCLVLPSDGETWGLVVNEAMASGLPCIVSDRVGCAPDLVRSGVTGEVVPRADPSALAAAIGRMRNGYLAGTDFSAACRSQIQRYSFSNATRGLLAAARLVAPIRPIVE